MAAGCVLAGVVVAVVLAGVVAGFPQVNPPRPPTGVLGLEAATPACPRAPKPDFAASVCCVPAAPTKS